MILQRLPGERFSEVLPLWRGGCAIVIACGHSLTTEQVELARIARASARIAGVIAVNDSYLLAPWADVLYAADAHWHNWHTDGIAKPRLGLTAQEVREHFASFAGQKCSIQCQLANLPDDATHVMRNRDYPNHGVGLSLDPRALVTGRNGGFQALNLAVLAGATTVLLLGFDGATASDGRDHFHGGHPRPVPPAAYPQYRQAMSAAERPLEAAGVRVINCSPGSKIDSFQKIGLQEALELAQNVSKPDNAVNDAGPLATT